MKHAGTILVAAALACTPGVATGETLAERGAAKFLRLIEGRVAGPPVACLAPFRRSRLTVVEYVGLVYGRGDTIYIARVEDPRTLGFGDAAVFDAEATELCYYDVGQSVNQTGSSHRVVLGPFVPYTKRGPAGA